LELEIKFCWRATENFDEYFYNFNYKSQKFIKFIFFDWVRKSFPKVSIWDETSLSTVSVVTLAGAAEEEIEGEAEIVFLLPNN
jgi:hypothetical protein